MSIQGYWAEVCAPDFSHLPPDTIAVLPLGATEQHGPHLPINVDTALIDEVARKSLALLHPDQNVLVLPTLSITKSGEHDRHLGTLSLSGDTLMTTLRDIARSVTRTGVKRLILFNGHGGNAAVLEIAAREMQLAHDLTVVACSWFRFANYDGLISTEDLSNDLHAGFIETSAMLAAHPNLVDMTRAAHFHTAMENWAKSTPSIGLSGQPARPGWIINDLNDQGACGNAAAATAEAGMQLLGSAAQGFADFLKAFAQFEHRGTTS